jgi:hypothetical protein
VPQCALHPVATDRICARCGAFTCDGCLSADGRICSRCFVLTEQQISGRAYAAIALGLIGLFGVLPAAIAVPFVVRRERTAIQNGDSPRGGSDVLTSATWLAWITLVAWGVPAVIYCVWWLFFRS